MSTLGRFRKPGGLLQLIRLIETSESEKRKQLLGLIAKEDPGWAHMVQAKTLSFERIMSWPDRILEELLEDLPVNLIVSLIQMGSAEDASKILRCHPRRLEKEIRQKNEDREVDHSEKVLALNKLLLLIRDLQDQGRLSFATFDPGLDIDLRLAG